MNIFCGPSISVQMIDRSVLFYVNDDHCVSYKTPGYHHTFMYLWFSIDMSRLFNGTYIQIEMQLVDVNKSAVE